MNDRYSIGGIQQIGIGTEDINRKWNEARALFGFDTVIFRERARAELMLRYTRGVAEEREALLALNLYGGGGFEVWQYVSRAPQKAKERILPGALGIYAVCLRSANVAKARAYLQQYDTVLCTSVQRAADDCPYFFCRDTDGNIFQIIEQPETLYRNLHPIGGVTGAIIGCSDIEKARPLYSNLLGYDQVIHDKTLTFAGDSFFVPSATADEAGAAGEARSPQTANEADAAHSSHKRHGNIAVRSVLLARGKEGAGSPFSAFYGQSTIELWQLLPNGAPAESHIFHKRQWGDVGFIHLCFEVAGMDALKQAAESMGVRFTVDSGDTFGMGEAGGRFAYIEDADGTLIEFVETHRIQLLKIPPISLNVQKRAKPLPIGLLKLLRLKRARAPIQHRDTQ